MNWADQPYAIGRGIAAIRGKNGNLTRFIRGCLDWSLRQLLQRAGGSTFPNLSYRDLATLEIPMASLPTQRTIAAILSAYDDLVENIDRRLEILEETAERIYREWFVYFRYPGHEGVSLVESELGPIPPGWVVRRLGDVATVDKGLSYKGAFLTDQGLPMANLKCFLVGGGFRRDGTKPYSGDFRPRHSVVAGDLIMANTDLTQVGGVIGSPAIIPRRGFENGGLISHHLFAIRPRVGGLTNAVLFHMLADERFRQFARGRASGTTVLGFRTADCEAYRLAVPTPDVLARFGDIVDDILSLSEILRELIESSRATRDLLLPRLISGEIDLEGLNIEIPEAAA